MGGNRLVGRVFPAHAGMSRLIRRSRPVRRRFPRTRGDEPLDFHAEGDQLLVFPAHAGMSRWRQSPTTPASRFPRTRGDEPAALKTMLGSQKFSPHTRG